MAAPEFIDATPELISAEVLATFEEGLKKSLLPAQPERLLVNVAAYRELLVRLAIQQAAERCLVNFSDGVYLDQLGALNGATRLPASSAQVTIRFSLIGGGATLIPQGTRVTAPADGQIWFATNEAATIPEAGGPGLLSSVDVVATAIATGPEFNGFLAGQIRTAVDPLPDGVNVINMTESSGGGNEELDDPYRERIKLAPNQFNSAGSRGSYEFYARSADASIIDVAVLNGGAVNVDVYPLTTTGLPSAEIIQSVDSVLSAEDVRPLTDIVRVQSPSEYAYQIDVDVTLLSSADALLLQTQLQVALDDYAEDRRSRLGQDVIRAQIVQSLTFEGVYNVVVNQPAADAVLLGSQWANATAVTLNIVGEADG